MTRRQQVLNDRQIQILQKLSLNGKKTKSELSAEFDVKYAAIAGSMKILEEKNMIEIAEKKPGRGRTKLFYEITDDGLKALSRDPRITLEQFWEIAFLVFDMKTNPKINLSFEDFLSTYEKNVLGYNVNYALLGWGIILEDFGIVQQIPSEPTPTILVLNELGLSGSQTLQEISKRFAKNENMKKYKIKNFNTFFSGMILNKLILPINSKQRTKYRLSSLGFLLLMNYIDKNRMSVMDREQSRDSAKIIRTIIENATFIPLISDSWSVLREIISEHNVTQFFKFMANSFRPMSNAIQLKGISELLIVERIMGKTYQNLIGREHTVGIKTIAKLTEAEKYTTKHSKIYQRLLYLGILNGFRVQEQDKFLHSLMGNNFSLDELIDKAISNKICFEFFTYFIDWVLREKNMAGDPDEKKHDRIAKWHYLTVKKWNRFQKNNKKFRDWYNSWIDEIRSFEERNVKILKERNFLEV